jgi:hypothetical protein
MLQRIGRSRFASTFAPVDRSKFCTDFNFLTREKLFSSEKLFAMLQRIGRSRFTLFDRSKFCMDFNFPTRG